MKLINRISIITVLILTLIMTALLPSCKKDDLEEGQSKKIVVDSITLHNKTTTTEVVTQVRTGTLIRINGTGFSTAKAIYCNGVKVSVNPNYVTEQAIILTIPSTTPFGKDVADTAVRNTIRIVTNYDDYTYRFFIQGPAPVISGVSHSLPKVGEKLQIYGTNLRDLDTIIFPGNVFLTAGQFQTDDSYTKITCVVPQGATTTPGGIYVHGDNGSAYSFNYMNRSESVFIKKFSSDASVSGGTGDCYQRAYNYGSSSISANQSALLPGSGDGHKNPETYRQFPQAVSDIPVESTVGSFDFRTCPAVTSVLQTSNGAITPATSCSNLALQFDYFIPVEWASGLIRFEFIKGSTDWRYNYAPWTSNGNVTPVKMNGWQTATIPLAAFKALNGKTLQYLVDQAPTKGGYFAFINGTYTDGSGKSFAPSAIKGFQLSFGNFRIVPYVKTK